VIEPVGDVGPCAHVQLCADPFEGHGGLGPEAFGNANLALVSFEGGVEVEGAGSFTKPILILRITGLSSRLCPANVPDFGTRSDSL
jgi:hypothetical protein